MESTTRFLIIVLISLDLMYGTAAQTFTEDSEGRVHLTYRILEDSSVPRSIGNVASDGRLLQRNGLTTLDGASYRILRQDTRFPRYFSISSTSGEMELIQSIDRDTSSCDSQLSECAVSVDVGITYPDRSFEAMFVTVMVLDVNDNAPTFSEPRKELTIPETVPVGVTFMLPRPVDLDAAQYGIQQYALTNNQGPFELITTNKSHGVELRLGLTGPLDRETRAQYTMNIVVTDGGSPARSGTLDVIIQVSDSNDNSPQFTEEIYEVTVPEDKLVGELLCTVTALDSDLGTSGDVQYVLAQQSSQWSHMFDVDIMTGEITLSNPLDHEEADSYQLVINAYDLGPDPIPSSTEVVINVQDVNDNEPSITVDGVTSGGVIEVMENLPRDTVVAHIFVDDSDAGLNGVARCTMNSNAFYITEVYTNMFQLKTSAGLDRERADVHRLVVTCSDGGTPAMTSVESFNVHVQDHNDHAPIFTQASYVASVHEGNALGIPIQFLNASDDDSGPNSLVTYHVVGTSDVINVDPLTGLVTTAMEYDYEGQTEYRVEVMAQDGGNPPQSTISDVIIHVVNMNDEPPMFLSQNYDFSVSEESDSGTYVGKVDTISIDLAATNDTYYYIDSSTNSAEMFQIDVTSGEILTARQLDREEHAQHTLLIIAMNSQPSGPSASVLVHVSVDDVNDNAPTITYPTNRNNTVNISNSVKRGEECFVVEAFDSDAGRNGQLFYSIEQTESEELFRINSETGSVSAVKDLRTADKWIYKLLIYARDHGTPALTSVVECEVKLHSGHGGDTNSLAVSRGGLEQNEVVVIAIAIVTAILVTLLLIAIVVVRRSNHQRNKLMNQKMKHHLMTLEAEVDGTSSINTSADTKESVGSEDSLAVITEASKMQYTKLNNTNSGSHHSNSHPHAVCYPNVSPKYPPQQLQVQTLLPVAQEFDGSSGSVNSGNSDSGKGLSDDAESFSHVDPSHPGDPPPRPRGPQYSSMRGSFGAPPVPPKVSWQDQVDDNNDTAPLRNASYRFPVYHDHHPGMLPHHTPHHAQRYNVTSTPRTVDEHGIKIHMDRSDTIV